MAWNEPGGNDPWGNKNRGGKNNNGNQPPDLDEALKQLMNKLNSLFGGKKSNGSGSNKSSGGNGGFIGIFVVIIAVTLLFNSVYTLDEQKRGVLLRLGKYQSTEMPGLHFKIPFVDQVIPVNTTAVRTLEIRERMLTEDENIVEVELNAQYRTAVVLTGITWSTKGILKCRPGISVDWYLPSRSKTPRFCSSSVYTELNNSVTAIMTTKMPIKPPLPPLDLFEPEPLDFRSEER